MADEFGEKTEAPTPKRKREAAEQGDVLRSREFATALVVMAGCAWLALAGPSLVAAFKAVMASSFQFGRADIEDFSPFRPLLDSGWKLAPSIGSLFAVTLVAAVLSQAGLGSLSFNGTLLAPKASRIDPAAGLKRILGPQGWIELAKSLLKVALLGSIGVYLLLSISKTSIGLLSSDVESAVGSLGGTLMGVMFTMAGGLLIIAGVDVPIQIIRLLGKLRMTKQAIRDENKESEGSPEAKGAIRARQREVMKRGMRQAVAEAHVVLTNPTHFAVALRYDRANDQVPVVVAKGRGVMALAIRELAAESKVPILEYPSVARAIYYTSREGQEVRDDLYLAIATILAFVFGINVRAGGSPPPVAVPPTARFDENGVKQS
ncbi:MAG: flagellar biosynthesis protein FlhB [Sphingomonas bacterium]|uniref:flagellar type III secretion system protein FlhB n=1 Tax=Sphingomonas bacterium TaxID=1895847 RepID=UPI00261CE13E|nr:flagellar type III secretion system protein FlhB [Sphingomonas bacterium]MDB5706669.1 flagellar biosynthesis protein FlhB [Sphingomonas bacterium]